MSLIKKIRDSQFQTFQTGQTKYWEFRKTQLKKLKSLLIQHHDEIILALANDLGKSEFESISTEILLILEEINTFLKHGKEWSKTKKVARNTITLDGQGEIVMNPFGLALIISPWNYPLQLSLVPLVAAIGAGNCVMLKPSRDTPHTSAIMAKIINNNFDSSYMAVVYDDVNTQELLELEFDKIFFTGSPKVGTIIMEKAAQNLTDVTLELGGKSPAIIDNLSTTNLKKSLKRIIWGKFLNSGQTCICPDYILLNKELESKVAKLLPEIMKDFIAEKPQCKIINKKNYDRMMHYLKDCEIIFGGKSSEENLSMELTFVKVSSLDVPVIQEEIFGPILPIITYTDIKDARRLINKICPYPLAMYIFSDNKEFTSYFLNNISFGGACVNDTISHILVHDLPFGGVRTSGIGSYHGKHGFLCFSRQTSIFRKGFAFEIPFRYPPYSKNLTMIKKILKKAMK